MSAAVVVLVVGIGWLLRRARSGRRPSPAEAGRATDPINPLGSVLRVVHRRMFGASAVVDPAPLLRFRTAVERGASAAQALEAVAAGSDRWASDAARAVRRVRAGASVQEAIDAWAEGEPDPSVQLFADALAISAATGGSHLRAVDAVIEAVWDRAALQREIRALASQAQTSAVVLVLLPIGFALAVGLADPRVRALFTGSPVGLLCIAVGASLDLAGAWIMARLVRSVA